MTVSQRRELEIEQRRERILDAAEAVFAERGLHAAQMKHIAAKAQLGKGTLYLYFSNKEELLMGVGVRRQSRLLGEFNAIVAEHEEQHDEAIVVLFALFEAYLRHMGAPNSGFRLVVSRWADSRPLDTSSEQSGSMAINVQNLFGIVCDVIAKGQHQGSIRRDMRPGRLTIQLLSSVNGALLTELQMACLGSLTPVDRMPELNDLLRVAIDALRPPALMDRSSDTQQGASDVA